MTSGLSTANGNITTNTNNISSLQSGLLTANTNITTNTNNISTLTSGLSTANTNITTLQGNVTTLDTNKVNKSDVFTRALNDKSDVNVATTGYGGSLMH